jgi:hypothetical protein
MKKLEIALWHPSDHRFLYLVKIKSVASNLASVSYTITFAKGNNILGADVEMPNPTGFMKANEGEVWRGHQAIKNIFEVKWA